MQAREIGLEGIGSAPGKNQITWDELWPYWARWVANDRANGESVGKIADERQT